jgi:hypothetical protein
MKPMFIDKQEKSITPAYAESQLSHMQMQQSCCFL